MKKYLEIGNHQIPTPQIPNGNNNAKNILIAIACIGLSAVIIYKLNTVNNEETNNDTKANNK